MKSKKGESQPARPIPRSRSRGQTFQIILLDQTSLRSEATSACQREMARLQKARAEWKRFEHDDKSAFARWCAATFGPLLSTMREVEASLREKSALLHEVELEMMFGGAASPRSAYRRVMKRRNSPPPEPNDTGWNDHTPPPSEDDDNFEQPNFDDLSEFEQEFVFEEYLIGVVGMNPDRMSDRQYFRMFEDFKQTMRKASSGTAAPPPSGAEYAPEQPPSTPTSQASRVKELYRLLVRRLHPDTRAESDAEVSALWHEVQEAYGQGNIERLEMLLALTDIQSNEAGDHTSLAQMQSVLEELIRSFKALQKNIRAAKKERAWNFSRLPSGGRLIVERRMRAEYEEKLRNDRCELMQLETLIKSWEDRPKSKPASAKSRGKKRISVAPSDLP